MISIGPRVLKNFLNQEVLGICLQILGVIALSVTSFACALYSGNTAPTVIKTCSVPADQSGTVSGHWPTTPIPIAFHQGDFTAAEMLAMTNAADTWNTFYTASESLTVFDYGGSNTSPRQSSSDNSKQGGSFCVTGIMQAGAFTGNMVIYKLGNWPYTSSAIALTSFCPSPATPYPNFYMALMEVNYQNFFVSGSGKYPDLQSIVLHELGHVLGLNHSCEAFAKANTPLCTESNINPDYVNASMFPSFSFDQTGAGNVRQTLNNNDESRANCLYNPSPSSSATPTSSH